MRGLAVARRTIEGPARVAERQTLWPQKPLPFGACGFESHPGYWPPTDSRLDPLSG
jgi:hypothetical protein